MQKSRWRCLLRWEGKTHPQLPYRSLVQRSTAGGEEKCSLHWDYHRGESAACFKEAHLQCHGRKVCVFLFKVCKWNVSLKVSVAINRVQMSPPVSGRAARTLASPKTMVAMNAITLRRDWSVVHLLFDSFLTIFTITAHLPEFIANSVAVPFIVSYWAILIAKICKPVQREVIMMHFFLTAIDSSLLKSTCKVMWLVPFSVLIHRFYFCLS